MSADVNRCDISRLVCVSSSLLLYKHPGKTRPALFVGDFISAASDASETLYTYQLVTVGSKKQEVMSQAGLSPPPTPPLRGARTVIERSDRRDLCLRVFGRKTSSAAPTNQLTMCSECDVFA